MLHKSFKPAKCKTSLKLAVSRIKLLRNKREEQVRKMRRELAQLLESGQEQTARIRVEHVIREEKTLAAYDLIELYCELIVARLPIIESQKSCPIDLKEAISTVIFASPRCADLPELLDVRKHFAAKYGKDFITSSLEVRPDCGVSRLVVEKLSARAPDAEAKIKVLKSISEEHNVKWDSKAFEEQHQKPHNDLLNGPNVFSGASKIPVESSNVKSSYAPTQTNESSMRMAPNNTASRPSSSNFSHANTGDPDITSSFSSQSGIRSSVAPNNTASRPPSSSNSQTNTGAPDSTTSFSSQADLRSSENRFGSEETRNSNYREENAHSNRPNWNMEFPDAISAARAAAESAERASMAARVAAELASRGHMSRQNSTESNVSPTGNKYERPERLRGLLGEDFVEEPAARPTEILRSQEMKTEDQNLQAEGRVWGVSRREAGRTSDDNSGANKPPSRSPSHSSHAPSRSSSHSSQAYVDDDGFDANLYKDDVTNYGHSQEKYNPSNQAYMDFTSSEPSFSQYSSVFDEKSENIKTHKFDDYESETTRMNAGERFQQSNSKLSNSGDYSAVVFDDYTSDKEDSHSLFGRNRGNLLDPYQGEEHSGLQSNISANYDKSGSFSRNSGAQLHLFNDEENSGVTVPAKSFENVAAFDDSDGEGTEGSETRPNSFRDNHRMSMGSSVSGDSVRGSTITYPGEEKAVRETISTSGGIEEAVEKNLHSDDNLWKRSSSISQPSTRSQKVVAGSDDSSSDDEDLRQLHSTRRLSLRETDGKEKMEISSGPLGAAESPEISDDLSSQSEQRLDFGNLTGGFKQRGFSRPPYVRASANQPSDRTSSIEKPIVSQLDNPAASFDVADQGRQNHESRAQAHASRTSSGVSVPSSSNSAKGFPSQNASEITDSPQESFYQRSHGKGQKEVRLSSARTYYDEESTEQSNVVDSKAYGESVVSRRKQNSYPSSPRESNKTMGSSEVLEPKVPSSRIDDSSEENFDAYSVGSRVNAGVKLSRRTRDMPSEARRSSLNVSGNSNVTPPFRKENQLSRASFPASEPIPDSYVHDGSYKPSRSNPSARQPSEAPKQAFSKLNGSSNSSQVNQTDSVASTNNLKPKPSGSTGESTAREDSLKSASHTHPKLPDYESLAAHFHSLRSNKR